MFRISRNALEQIARVPVVSKPTNVKPDRPIVILSAWAGAREKTLKQFSKMYSEMGYASIIIGVDLSKKTGLDALLAQQSFWDTETRRIYTDLMAENFDKIWTEYPELKEPRLVTHTFSNNGIQTWCNVRELLPKPVGFVFDSGPSNPISLDIPGKIFRSNNPNAPLSKKIAVSMVGNIGWAAAHFILPFKNDFLFPVFLVKMVPDIVSDADSLVLLAKDDIICPPPSVRKEYKRIVNHGKSNCTLEELNGGHCMMLKEDNENYRRIIKQFMDKL